MTTARSTRSAPQGVRACQRLLAAARRIACGPATDAISRSPASDNAEPRGVAATASARRAKPRWSTAAASTAPRPRTASPIRNCRTRSAIATRSSAGCTCNGKDQIGLAPVKIENDPTLRKGDIVAGENGLMVAGRGADKRGADAEFLARVREGRARNISACRWWRGSKLESRSSSRRGARPAMRGACRARLSRRETSTRGASLTMRSRLISTGMTPRQSAIKPRGSCRGTA